MWAIYKVIFVVKQKKNNKKLRLCPICLHLKTPIQQVKNIEGRTYLVNNSTAFTLLITTEETRR